MQVYRNFIGGEFVQSQGTRRLANTNPANTNDVLGEAILATKAEAAAAVAAAAAAFSSLISVSVLRTGAWPAAAPPRTLSCSASRGVSTLARIRWLS